MSTCVNKQKNNNNLSTLMDVYAVGLISMAGMKPTVLLAIKN
jgi:hypothetical protein